MALESLQSTAIGALQTLLAGQPTTPAKVGFAWRIAAGQALGRATTITWTTGGTLRVHASSPAWRREAARAKPVIATRLDQLLGAGVVQRIIIDTGPTSER
ncbi:MAG: DciA family protein [Vicinamibacterales bacterium]